MSQPVLAWTGLHRNLRRSKASIPSNRQFDRRRKIAGPIDIIRRRQTFSLPARPSSDNEWYDLYLTVAQQDPDWFEEHIVSLLYSDGHDNIVDTDMLDLVKKCKKTRRQKIQSDNVASPTIGAFDASEDTAISNSLLVDATVDSIIQETNVSLDSGISETAIEYETETIVVQGELASSETIALADATKPTPTNKTETVVSRGDVEYSESKVLVDESEIAIRNATVVAPGEPRLSETNGAADETTNSTAENENARVANSHLTGEERRVKPNRTILYFDEDEWKQIDLSNVLQLGYSELEISRLQPTVVKLIAADIILRPRTGVPERWMLPPAGEDFDEWTEDVTLSVKIVSAASAATAIEELQAKYATTLGTKTTRVPQVETVPRKGHALRANQPNQVDDPTSSSPATAVTPEQTRRSSSPPRQESLFVNNTLNSTTPAKDIPSTNATPQILNESSRPTTSRTNKFEGQRWDAAPPPPLNDRRNRRPIVEERVRRPELSRRRESEDDDMDARRRRVYSGRLEPPESRRTSGKTDPPSPKSGLWPDLDTFRSLLRNEAGMRLRILGNDWSEKVKEESDWRLDLYKNWLWTLNDGVGDPIVESRSDRARRQQRSEASSASSPKKRRRRE